MAVSVWSGRSSESRKLVGVDTGGTVRTCVASCGFESPCQKVVAFCSYRLHLQCSTHCTALVVLGVLQKEMQWDPITVSVAVTKKIVSACVHRITCCSCKCGLSSQAHRKNVQCRVGTAAENQKYTKRNQISATGCCAPHM